KKKGVEETKEKKEKEIFFFKMTTHQKKKKGTTLSIVINLRTSSMEIAKLSSENSSSDVQPEGVKSKKKKKKVELDFQTNQKTHTHKKKGEERRETEQHRDNDLHLVQYEDPIAKIVNNSLNAAKRLSNAQKHKRFFASRHKSMSFIDMINKEGNANESDDNAHGSDSEDENGDEEEEEEEEDNDYSTFSFLNLKKKKNKKKKAKTTRQKKEVASTHRIDDDTNNDDDDNNVEILDIKTCRGFNQSAHVVKHGDNRITVNGIQDGMRIAFVLAGGTEDTGKKMDQIGSAITIIDQFWTVA
ncbi:bromodomain adjacent to zinc finger domain protein, partial [Reticulomyxa filosa]